MKKDTSKKYTMHRERFEVSGRDVVRVVKKILKEGNARRIVIANEKDDILLEIPLTFAVVGAVIAPLLATIGAIAALLTKCTIIVERKD